LSPVKTFQDKYQPSLSTGAQPQKNLDADLKETYGTSQAQKKEHKHNVYHRKKHGLSFLLEIIANKIANKHFSRTNLKLTAYTLN